MSKFINRIRAVRDFLWKVLTIWKSKTTILGVNLIINDPVISNRMRYVLCRGYETDDANVVESLISAEDRVLECGSSIGFISIYTIKNIGVAKYAMVEANPELNHIVDNNYRINSINKRGPYINAAVSSRDCELKFQLHKNFWSSSILRREGISKSINIKGCTLSTLRSSLGFDPNVLIMDIEGAEVDIPVNEFKHFEKIVIEMHPKLSGKEKTDIFLEKLLKLGFTIMCKKSSTIGLRRESQVNKSHKFLKTANEL